MNPAKPSRNTWLFAISYGLGAYGIHKYGVIVGLYRSLFWFQMLTHFLSATALALLLVVAGRSLGLSARRLVGFVVIGCLLGAVGWEFVEYLELIPWLIWWGIEDSLLDLLMDGFGVSTVLLVWWRRQYPADPADSSVGRRRGFRAADD